MRHPALALALALLPLSTHAVERGPHPQQVDSTSAVLVWQGADAIRLTLGGPGGKRILAPPEPDAHGRVRLTLDGLKPGARYRYTLDTPAGPLDGRFQTPPAAGTPFTLVAYGDSRTDHRIHRALAGRIAAADPDMVLHTGDLVTRGHRDGDWAAFFEAATPILRRAPLIPVLGNHDLDGGDPTPLLRHFAAPGDRTYFGFTWADTRVLALDSEVAATDADGAPDAVQRDWIRAELKAAAADPAIRHVIAFIHKGPFSAHPGRSGNLGLRAMLPELRAAGLDLIISGHDHYYERGEDASGLPYLILGGGGAPLYETVGPGQRPGYTAHVSRPLYSFARLRVLGDRIEGCGVDLSGAPFDCFTLPASGQPAPAPAPPTDGAPAGR